MIPVRRQVMELSGAGGKLVPTPTLPVEDLPGE